MEQKIEVIHSQNVTIIQAEGDVHYHEDKRPPADEEVTKQSLPKKTQTKLSPMLNPASQKPTHTKSPSNTNCVGFVVGSFNILFSMPSSPPPCRLVIILNATPYQCTITSPRLNLLRFWRDGSDSFGCADNQE